MLHQGGLVEPVSQQSPFTKGFDPSNPLSPLGPSKPLPTSLATTQPVARRRTSSTSDSKQRWLLLAASTTALAVWSTFGLLYYQRHGVTGSFRSVLSRSPESVSISLSPPVAVKTTSAAAEPSLAPEPGMTGAAKAAAAPARAAPAAAAALEGANGESPAAPARPTGGRARAEEQPATARARAEEIAARARVEEAAAKAASGAKARPARPRAPGERQGAKKRPIDEGF